MVHSRITFFYTGKSIINTYSYYNVRYVQVISIGRRLGLVFNRYVGTWWLYVTPKKTTIGRATEERSPSHPLLIGATLSRCGGLQYNDSRWQYSSERGSCVSRPRNDAAKKTLAHWCSYPFYLSVIGHRRSIFIIFHIINALLLFLEKL